MIKTARQLGIKINQSASYIMDPRIQTSTENFKST